MKILAIGAVESTDVHSQLASQTIKPDNIILWKDEEPVEGIDNRRKRISANQYRLMGIAEALNPDLVWQIEGDGVYPPDTLQKLLKLYLTKKDKNLAYVSGVQVGRHGIYCLGAWQFNNDRTVFKSLDYKETKVTKVDATGFYCLLAPLSVFISGKPDWNGERWGPDVNWGLSLKGEIYADPNIPIGHKSGERLIMPSDKSLTNVEFTFNNDKWTYKTHD